MGGNFSPKMSFVSGLYSIEWSLRLQSQRMRIDLAPYMKSYLYDVEEKLMWQYDAE